MKRGKPLPGFLLTTENLWIDRIKRSTFCVDVENELSFLTVQLVDTPRAKSAGFFVPKIGMMYF